MDKVNRIIDDKRRMMFILEEDYYYITMRIMIVLIALKCHKKPFIDYKKMGILLEALKSDMNNRLMCKSLRREVLDVFDREQLISLYCHSKSNNSVVKRIMFFLEKKEYITFEKIEGKAGVNILLTELGYRDFVDLVNEQENEIKRINCILQLLKSARYIKVESLYDKVFGEVRKWED